MHASSCLAPSPLPSNVLKATATSLLLLGTSILLSAACSTSGKRGTTPEELQAYKSQHYEALPREIRGTATDEELWRRLSKGSLLLIGDIHDDRALHVLHAQVLKQLILRFKRIILHVEFLGQEDEDVLQEFLAGEIDLDEMRQIVQERWPGSWMEFQGFDAGFYRNLLSSARDHGVEVQALEPIPRLALQNRDRAMARRISTALEQSPEALHIVIIGHTHLLGTGHLLALLAPDKVLVLLPRGGEFLTHRLGAFASTHSAAWHAPYLVLDDDLWLLNPLPLRSLSKD